MTLKNGDSSPVFEAQLRWNTLSPLTLELSSEVFEPFIEFINNSHVTAATISFKLAVQLLFAANKYDVKELQDYLLDLFYVQPLSAFNDVEALVELYLLLEVTRLSECVFKRITGIVKLKASEIMSSPIFQQHLEPLQKSLINCVIESYDVFFDPISLWRDNKHATWHADHYVTFQNRLEENARVQAIHKRKPWQLCCDYLNYCNFKTGSDEPAGEKPKQLIKIEKRINSEYEFLTFPRLVLETDQIS